jgi:dGTPase
MEVAQISRAVSTALHLNEDLAEALALVHDIGHPPFGHAGEHALDACLMEHGLRFDHNLHALRIVEFFEQRYAAFRGLNLTLAVREGIVKHSRDYTLEQHPELAPYMLDQQPPLEAQLIDWADEIAYLTADLDDGIESGVLEVEHIREHVPLFAGFYSAMQEEYPRASERLMVNEALKRVLNALVDDLVHETSKRLDDLGIHSLSDVRRASVRIVGFSAGLETARRNAKQYLYQHLYQSSELAKAHSQAERVISTLFRCWNQRPALLPSSCAADVALDGVPRTVADYIAGMTDPFILAQYDAQQMNCE